MKFSQHKCFVVVFNSLSRKPDLLPHLRLGSYWMKSYYPTQISEVYLGWNITDRVSRTKLSKTISHLHSKVPHYRSKPNHRYLKRIKNKFNRSRGGIHQLCPNKEILTPIISIRLFKTLQRSILLYAIELCDWDVDQVNDLETLQAKAIRSHFSLDQQCPKATH